VDDFNASPAMATTAVYDELNGFAKDLRETVNAFRSDPKKYLRMKVF